MTTRHGTCGKLIRVGVPDVGRGRIIAHGATAVARIDTADPITVLHFPFLPEIES